MFDSQLRSVLRSVENKMGYIMMSPSRVVHIRGVLGHS